MMGMKTIYNRIFLKRIKCIPFIKRSMINVGKTLQMNILMSE